MKHFKEYFVLYLMTVILLFLLDYSRVTACPNVANYERCSTYMEHYFGE